MNPRGLEASDREKITSPIDELLAAVGTTPEGLPDSEAEERLARYGPNTLPTRKKVRILQKMLIQVKNLFNILLLVAAGLSFLSGVMADDQTSINMGYAIVAVVVISILFSVFQEQRAEKAVEAIKELVPSTARVTREGRTKQIGVADIVSGDIIQLEEGDRVPADARLVKAYNLAVDNSILTGESLPQTLSSDPPAGEGVDMRTARNIVLAGTTIVSGSGTAVVVGTGGKTEFGKIVSMTAEIEQPPSPLQRELDKAAKLDTIVAVAVGFTFLLITYFFLKLTLTESILFMIGVMICFVPEGLQMTTALVLAMSSKAMSKRNVVVKRLSSVETLGSTTVICTDKTGTLTAGQMTVRAAWVPDREFLTTGEGYNPSGKVMADNEPTSVASDMELRALCLVGALDNNSSLTPPAEAKKTRWTAVGDTTDAALLAFAMKSGMDVSGLTKENVRIGMVPFDSNRKMMTTIHKEVDGTVTAYVKGAGNEVLSRCTTARVRGKTVPMTDELRALADARIAAFSKETYRVLAMATRRLAGTDETFTSESVERELEFVGLAALLDPPRPEIPEAVHRARSAGIRIVMMTGDHELTAEAIARKVGIITSPDYKVTSGRDLEAMDDRELDKLAGIPELVFARITPEQKLRIVKAFRRKGEIVAVTGDGVNDAPALLEADIGVAMGMSGTDVARESADMVLLDDNFASIVNGIEEGRAVFDNIRRFITYIFCHNWAELMTFLAFILLGTPLPLAVIQVLLIDLLLEIPPSLSLTMEPPEPGIMERLPRRRDSKLFGLNDFALSAAIGIIIGLASLFWCFHTWTDAGWSLGMSEVADRTVYLEGMTIVTACIIAGQLGTLFTLRTSLKSAFSVNPMRNIWLPVSVVLAVAMLAVFIYVPFFQPVFSLAPIPPLAWLLLYSTAPAVILFDEGRKAILRSRIMRVDVDLAKGSGAAGSSGLASATRGVKVPDFIERSGPILVVLDAESPDSTALSVAAGMGAHAGSRVVVARIVGAKTRDWMLKRFDILLEEATGAKVPTECVDVPFEAGGAGRRKFVAEMRSLVSSRKAGAVVVSVEQGVFKGSQSALKRISWMDRELDVNVVLVSGKGKGGMHHHPRKILIPVLSSFHREQFELVSAMKASKVGEEFDVLASRVIEIPAIVPLYALRKPESLVDVKEQTAFLDQISALSMSPQMRAELLMVRNYGRDLLSYVEENRFDVIVVGGSWNHLGKGFVEKALRSLMLKARCTTIVTVAREKR